MSSTESLEVEWLVGVKVIANECRCVEKGLGSLFEVGQSKNSSREYLILRSKGTYLYASVSVGDKLCSEKGTKGCIR
jgi:hypothetical protein